MLAKRRAYFAWFLALPLGVLAFVLQGAESSQNTALAQERQELQRRAGNIVVSRPKRQILERIGVSQDREGDLIAYVLYILAALFGILGTYHADKMLLDGSAKTAVTFLMRSLMGEVKKSVFKEGGYSSLLNSKEVFDILDSTKDRIISGELIFNPGGIDASALFFLDESISRGVAELSLKESLDAARYVSEFSAKYIAISGIPDTPEHARLHRLVSQHLAIYAFESLRSVVKRGVPADISQAVANTAFRIFPEELLGILRRTRKEFLTSKLLEI